METGRIAKYVGGLTALLVITSVSGVHIWNYSANQRIDSMSRDLHDAERPEEAYTALVNSFKELDYTEEEKEKFARKIENEDFSARLALSNKAGIDRAIQGLGTFDAMEDNATRVNYTGIFYRHCPAERLIGSICEKETGYPIYTHYAVGDFLLGQSMGGLHALWANDTASESFGMYLKRAEYYDSRLREESYDYRPVEIAAYTDHGLFLAGSHEGNISIDDRTVPVQHKGYFMYSDVNLSLGNHRIEAGNQSFDFKVAYAEPGSGVSPEGKMVIDSTTHYHKVILSGSKGNISRELKSDSRIEMDVPSESFIDKGTYDNAIRRRPFMVKLVSPEVNRTFRYGTPEPDVEAPINKLYTYGMTPEEYRQTREFFETMEKLPGIKKPDTRKLYS